MDIISTHLHHHKHHHHHQAEALTMNACSGGGLLSDQQTSTTAPAMKISATFLANVSIQHTFLDTFCLLTFLTFFFGENEWEM